MRAALLVVGAVILAADLVEDFRILRQAFDQHWAEENVRMVIGHAIREILVVLSLVAIARDSGRMVPYVIGAALHGLFFRSGYFIGVDRVPWSTPLTWLVLGDMAWRLGLLGFAWSRRKAFLAGDGGR